MFRSHSLVVEQRLLIVVLNIVDVDCAIEKADLIERRRVPINGSIRSPSPTASNEGNFIEKATVVTPAGV
jgi:hypothetical protein